MIELKGKYNIAKVFTDNIEESAKSQIIELCNQEVFKDSKIRIMPDVHSGTGCTIGTTMTIQDKIVPNLVGVDIGCGMLCIELQEKEIDLKLLDKTIKEYVPSGFNIREKVHPFIENIALEDLKCKGYLNLDRAKLSLGTLGGGNHFIEVNKDKDDNLYLVIHSGSRYLGKQVAEYYQNIAIEKLSNKNKRQNLIETLKTQGREKDIETELKNFSPLKIKKELAYLESKDFDDYIHDMNIVQMYAYYNRHAIANCIISEMDLNVACHFTTIHNYIDIESMTLRKGSISAEKYERVIIPINMRDGSIIALGKGNSDWNYSAPHGAGRLMSRSKAKENIKMDDFENSMNGIYTTSVNQSTIDEAPQAYKPMEEIIENIKDAVEIIDIIKPIYNFKAH